VLYSIETFEFILKIKYSHTDTDEPLTVLSRKLGVDKLRSTLYSYLGLQAEPMCGPPDMNTVFIRILLTVPEAYSRINRHKIVWTWQVMCITQHA